MHYRREIDGLRALAVIPVILFHAGFQVFSGGFVGVDVFFVISGYLITTIITAELAQGKFSLVKFYERRARRILPALFLVILISIPFAWAWLLPVDMKSFSHGVAAVSLFVSNILFWRESGYFAQAAELKPLLHTWSLAVEEQFYLLFPLFLMLIWRLGKRWVQVLLGIIFIASLTLAQWASFTMPAPAFYLLPTRGWELLMGSFTAFFLSNFNQSKINPHLREMGAWLGCILIFYAVFAFNKATPIPGLYGLVPTAGAALVILFATQQTMIGRALGHQTFVFIGLISYSAYLWHQPVFVFARIFTFNQISFYGSLFLILATFVLAIVSYRYVETPFRKGSKFSSRSVFKLSALGMVSFVLFGAIGHWKEGFSGRFPSNISSIAQAAGDWAFPDKLVKSYAHGFYKLDKNKPIQVLFFGDSHASHFAPLSSEIAKSGKNVGFLTGGGCPPIPVVHEDSHPHCSDLFARLNHVLSVETSLRSIVIAGCFNCYLINKPGLVPYTGVVHQHHFLQDGERINLKSDIGHIEALKKLKTFTKELSLRYKVVVVGDNPNHSSFDPSVYASYMVRGQSNTFKSYYPDFGVDGFKPIDAQVELDQEIQAMLDPDIKFISSMAIVCPKGQCRSLDIEGRPLYKDSNHMRPVLVINAFRDPIMDAIK